MVLTSTHNLCFEQKQEIFKFLQVKKNLYIAWASFRIMMIIYFQLLIGFESGAIVLWDLKNKTADSRYSSPEVGQNYLYIL